MKKIDFKSMLIGILLCTVFMLTIGAKSGDHSHSAKDITYQSWDWGTYGTLQKELSDIISKIDNKSDDNHIHYDYSKTYHTHY